MPAITADTLTLDRIARPDEATTRFRPVRKVVDAHRAVEGEGFVVRRPFPGGLSMQEADPFLLLDHIGSVELAPGEAKGTGWHPHRGFETVTYVMDGALEHKDSTGGGGTIGNGGTQWMTAGAGILHIERPVEQLVARGGVLHGVQLWVNLPRSDKLTTPRYQDIEGHATTLLSSDDGGALLRVIAGELEGHRGGADGLAPQAALDSRLLAGAPDAGLAASPADHSHRGPGRTWTPITYVHATVAAGARLAVPWPADFNALAYVLHGEGTVGAERRPLREGQLAQLGDGDALVLDATSELDVLLLGGRPLREPIAHHGPFVMNTKAELAQAFEDFQAGRLGRIPAAGR